MVPLFAAQLALAPLTAHAEPHGPGAAAASVGATSLGVGVLGSLGGGLVGMGTGAGIGTLTCWGDGLCVAYGAFGGVLVGSAAGYAGGVMLGGGLRTRRLGGNGWRSALYATVPLGVGAVMTTAGLLAETDFGSGVAAFGFGSAVVGMPIAAAVAAGTDPDLSVAIAPELRAGYRGVRLTVAF